MTLTREEILAKEPGPELDKLMDEIILQREFTEFPMGWCYHNGRGWVHASPYSSDISAAWEVVTHLRLKNWEFVIASEGDKLDVTFYWDPHRMEGLLFTGTLPEAISKAALLAVLNL